MKIETTITDSPRYFNGEVKVLLQQHDAEWCVIKIAPTEAQEDPEEWHYIDFDKALGRYNAIVKAYMPEDSK